MGNADSKIRKVLQKNIQIADEINSAASELSVVHAVLATTAPAEASGSDLQEAVERVVVIEKKLDDAAESLDDSNERLKDVLSD